MRLFLSTLLLSTTAVSAFTFSPAATQTWGTSTALRSTVEAVGSEIAAAYEAQIAKMKAKDQTSKALSKEVSYYYCSFSNTAENYSLKAMNVEWPVPSNIHNRFRKSYSFMKGFPPASTNTAYHIGDSHTVLNHTFLSHTIFESSNLSHSFAFFTCPKLI